VRRSTSSLSRVRDGGTCIRSRCGVLISQITAAVLLAVGVLAAPAPALADVYEGVQNFSAPKQPLSLTPEPPIEQQESPYLRIFGVRYDSTAGALTLFAGVYDPEYWGSTIPEKEPFVEGIFPGGERFYVYYSVLVSFAIDRNCPEAVGDESELWGSFGLGKGEIHRAEYIGEVEDQTSYANGVYSVTLTNPAFANLDLHCVTYEIGENPKTMPLNDLTHPEPKGKPLTAHRATKRQLAALRAVFRRYRHHRHYRRGLGRLEFLRSARVTNNGWALARIYASQSRSYEHGGAEMWFHAIRDHWRVVSFGTAPGVGHSIPPAVRRALGV
jgi:hypothetical protein